MKRVGTFKSLREETISSQQVAHMVTSSEMPIVAFRTLRKGKTDGVYVLLSNVWGYRFQNIFSDHIFYCNSLYLDVKLDELITKRRRQIYLFEDKAEFAQWVAQLFAE